MTHFSAPTVRELALQQARGSYQDNLLRGYESWSGASLKGKAKKWSGRYARSRDSLIARLTKVGLDCEFRYVGRYRRKVLYVKRYVKPKPPPAPLPPPSLWQRLQEGVDSITD